MSFCLSKLYNVSALLVSDLWDNGKKFEEVILKNPQFVFSFCLQSFLRSAHRCVVFTVSQTLGAGRHHRPSFHSFVDYNYYFVHSCFHHK